MAKQLTERQLLVLKIEGLSDSEVQELLDYLAIMESRRTRAATSVPEDEVVELLAEAAENRRARQAFEWETVRRRAERRAATRSGASA
ncbi:MAG TPA: hypothetical protein VJ124_24480 [Pyrinomonadaceae bacterium]|nr:hypothetical protein [Pyrinomonadaceae bacterium]